MHVMQSKFTKQTQKYFQTGAGTWCAGPGSAFDPKRHASLAPM